MTRSTEHRLPHCVPPPDLGLFVKAGTVTMKRFRFEVEIPSIHQPENQTAVKSQG